MLLMNRLSDYAAGWMINRECSAFSIVQSEHSPLEGTIQTQLAFHWKGGNLHQQNLTDGFMLIQGQTYKVKLNSCCSKLYIYHNSINHKKMILLIIMY